MDKILIHGISAVTIIGCLPHERTLPQPVRVDLALEVDLHDCGLSDDISDTTDYAKLIDVVIDLLRDNQDKMLERLAHRIALSALEFPRVGAVTVRLTKVRAPITQLMQDVAVELRRTAAEVAELPKSRATSKAIVGLGTNLGDRLGHLRHALAELGTISATSSIFETAPVGGPPGQGPFLNMAAIVETTLDPFAFLRKCRRIEAAAGRVRRERWGARTLDIDLLFYDDMTITSPELTVPHPRYAERDFVLAPLYEIAPERCPPAWNQAAATLRMTRLV